MADFVLLISDWYRPNKRDLPWRSTHDPYAIWLSEVILQQTRVDQGMNYYLKFISNFPTLKDLAAADEQVILKMWQGLGYYSRARNLLKTAQHIVNEFAGVFPDNYNDLLKLKGIGPYTAAAIASFAFNEPKAVVDGNVYRVLSRYYGIDTPIDTTRGQKEFQLLADSLIPKQEPGSYNQAIMEFGALHCTPNLPKCTTCPLNDSCLSYAENKVNTRPVKQGKTKIRTRYLHYFHLKNSNSVALEKRTNNEVWQNLYEFPVFESLNDTLPENHGLPIESPELVYQTKHVLSHQRIHAFFYRAAHFNEDAFNWVKHEDFESYPIHRLMEKYWEFHANSLD